jgi:hypothetical protein
MRRVLPGQAHALFQSAAERLGQFAGVVHQRVGTRSFSTPRWPTAMAETLAMPL